MHLGRGPQPARGSSSWTPVVLTAPAAVHSCPSATRTMAGHMKKLLPSVTRISEQTDGPRWQPSPRARAQQVRSGEVPGSAKATVTPTRRRGLRPAEACGRRGVRFFRTATLAVCTGAPSLAPASAVPRCCGVCEANEPLQSDDINFREARQPKGRKKWLSNRSQGTHPPRARPPARGLAGPSGPGTAGRP